MRQLLGLKQNLKMMTVGASVVSRDPTGIINTVVIDRGAEEGISRGDAVLDETGNLLGVVKEVFAHSGEFLLITDGLVKIDAKVAGKDILGIASGSHGLGLTLDLVSQGVKVEKGDKIITSGLTGSLPADILIGYADEPQSGSSELFQKLSIIPAAKLKDFRFVLVVTGF